MAALNIKWESVDRLSPNTAVATGGVTTEEVEQYWPDKPTLVLVIHDGDDNKDLEVILTNEKIALGTKAFRCVKMSPDNAANDKLIEGSDVPRFVIIDPIKQKVKVLEKSLVKASSLFKEMKRIAGNFYEENLDKLVKDHIKYLTEQDKLAKEVTLLSTKLETEDKEAKKTELEAELAKVKSELVELEKKQATLWELTKKS